MDRNSKTQRIKFYLEALLNSSYSHKSKPLALSRSTHWVFNKPPVENHYLKKFSLLRQWQRFPEKALPSAEQKPEQQFPHSRQISGVLHPISNESFKNPSFEINSLPWTSNTVPFWQNPTRKNNQVTTSYDSKNFNGNPLEYHEWINNFFCLVHNNSSITDTHRIKYLENAVFGEAKDVIQAYSFMLITAQL